MSPTHSPSLEEHIVKTYGVLRCGLGFLAIALPIVLAVGGFVKYGLMVQDSISAYYHEPIPLIRFWTVSRFVGNDKSMVSAIVG
jgi:hypothetical protein